MFTFVILWLYKVQQKSIIAYSWDSNLYMNCSQQNVRVTNPIATKHSSPIGKKPNELNVTASINQNQPLKVKKAA